MRKFPVEWADPALEDAEGIIEYLVVHGEATAAEKLLRSIEAATGRLASMPSRGRLVPELRREGIRSYRELILRPYRLIYRVTERIVIVVAFIDGRRDIGELLVERAAR